MLTLALFQGIASGVITGSVYALLAISIVIVFKSTEVVNFGGGEMLMSGTYLAMMALVAFDMPYVAAFGFVVVGMFVLGISFEAGILRVIAGRGRHGQLTLVALVVATVGLSYILKGVMRLFSYTEQARRLPSLFRGPPVEFGQVLLQRQDLVIVGIAVLVMLLLFAFFQFTFTGKALRAVSQNPRASSLVGIPVKRMRTAVWGGASILAGIAGVLIGAKFPVTPDFGGTVVLLSFAAAIIGGFNSLPGCVLGGVLLGVAQNLVGLYFSSAAIAVTPFVVIMAVLIIRPEGLLSGRSVLRKV